MAATEPHHPLSVRLTAAAVVEVLHKTQAAAHRAAVQHAKVALLAVEVLAVKATMVVATLTVTHLAAAA